MVEILGMKTNMEGDFKLTQLVSPDLREGYILVITIFNDEDQEGVCIVTYHHADSYFNLPKNKMTEVARYRNKEEAWKNHDKIEEDLMQNAHNYVKHGTIGATPELHKKPNEKEVRDRGEVQKRVREPPSVDMDADGHKNS